MTDLDEPAATELEPRPRDGDRALRSDERDGTAQLSDGPLVIGIAAGSHDALAEAYSRHGTGVHAAARRVCGERAADVTQDVFLGLWRRPERFDPHRGTLGAFLRIQARGRAVDLVRANGTRRGRENTDHRRRRDPAAPVEDADVGHEIPHCPPAVVPHRHPRRPRIGPGSDRGDQRRPRRHRPVRRGRPRR